VDPIAFFTIIAIPMTILARAATRRRLAGKLGLF